MYIIEENNIAEKYMLVESSCEPSVIATDEGRLWILSRKPNLNFPWLNSHIRYEFKKRLLKVLHKRLFNQIIIIMIITISSLAVKIVENINL